MPCSPHPRLSSGVSLLFLLLTHRQHYGVGGTRLPSRPPYLQDLRNRRHPVVLFLYLYPHLPIEPWNQGTVCYPRKAKRIHLRIPRRSSPRLVLSETPKCRPLTTYSPCSLCSLSLLRRSRSLGTSPKLPNGTPARVCLSSGLGFRLSCGSSIRSCGMAIS